jgi:hypothetical protein
MPSQNGGREKRKELYSEPSGDGASSSSSAASAAIASDAEEELGKRGALRKLADEMFQVKSSGQFEVDYLGESTKGDFIAAESMGNLASLSGKEFSFRHPHHFGGSSSLTCLIACDYA